MNNTNLHLSYIFFRNSKTSKWLFLTILILSSNILFGNTFFRQAVDCLKKEILNSKEFYNQELVACSGGTAPTASTYAIQPSCNNGIPQSDGYLQLSAIANGDRVNFSTGNTYSGDMDYANAMTIGALPFQFAMGQGNPSGTQDYTIRVFNGASNCFTDVVVTMNEQDCEIGCNCVENVYLNEVSNNGKIHRYTIDMTDTSFTEVLNGGNAWYPGAGTSQLPSPHGITLDINGNIYAGESYSNGQIRRLNCEGEIAPESDFLLDDVSGLTNIQSLRGDIIYTNMGTAWDICTESPLSGVTLCNDASENWGFYIDQSTGNFYSTTNFSGPNHVYKYTETDYGSGVCVPIFINESVLYANVSGTNQGNTRARGIVTDRNGNIYVAYFTNIVSGGTTNEGLIVKYDSNGNYVSHQLDAQDDGMGWAVTSALVYSEETGILYSATQSNVEPCVYAFSTEPTFAPIGPMVDPSGDTELQGTGNFNFAKGMGIIEQCCPTNNNITIDTTLCAAAVNDVLFLQTLTNCNGTICEGMWTEAAGNTGLSYNSCDNSVTIDALDACGSFTISSDGTGNNSQCGAFNITVNINVTTAPLATVATIPPSCTKGAPNNDGHLQISDITSGRFFNWSLGSNYTGSNAISDATDAMGMSFPIQFATGLSNPSGSQDYTIRVFSDTTACGGFCFTDYTVTIDEQDCLCSGNAIAVGATSTGVDYNTADPSAVLGMADGDYAELYDNSDRLILELTDTIASGETYSVTWRRKSTYSAGPFADLIIEESLDGVSWTFNPVSLSTDQQSFITSNITSVVPLRFLRIRIASNSNDDADIDAISYSGVVCSCINPTVSALAAKSTCTNGSANNDGYLQLSSVSNGNRYHWSIGSSFDDNGGTNNYDNATDILGATYPVQFAAGQTNPATSQDYTIRVYNCRGDCYTDVVVTMRHQDCIEGCDCTEVVYVNDVEKNEVHKFSVNSATGAFTEIGKPWLSGINDPHGAVVDLNGYMYIGEKNLGGPDNSRLIKLTCDGGRLDTLFAGNFNDNNVTNFVSNGNILYSAGRDDGDIDAYNLCTETDFGTISLPAGSSNWELFEGEDELMYTIDRNQNTLSIYNVPYDTTMYGQGNTISTPILVTDLTKSADDVFWGVDQDGFGNWYVVVRHQTGGTITGSTIYMLSPTGQILTSINDNNDGGILNPGLYGTRGIVYSPYSDRLYFSSFFESCIAVVDIDRTSGSEQLTFDSTTSVPGGGGKDISISLECCPTTNDITIDTTLCEASVNDKIFLQEFMNCDGTICEGLWQEGVGNTGLLYSDCDNSVTINSLDACGTFTLASDGAGNNPQCGAFNITINIEVGNLTGPVISGNQLVCGMDDPTAFTVTTAASGSGTINYQWQSSTTSCTDGFSNISGATADTYDAGIVSQTTYFRVLSSVFGGCNTSTCQDTSNCVTITYGDNPTATAATTSPTCTGATVNSNGTITLSGFNAGERYDFSTGSSYGGSATFASGSTEIPVDGEIANNLTNPTGSQDYTVRIFNSSGCFVDRAVTLSDTSCGPEFDYSDYSSGIRPCPDEPCHTVTSDLYLGMSVSADASPPTGTTADGDDDDGVSIGAKMRFTPGNTVNIPVTIYNNTSMPAYLRMWIDWNADGDFEDAGEQIEDNTYPSIGAEDIVFITATIPLNASQTSSLALRARLSTDDINSSTPCGNGTCAADGEIEDYLINISCPSPICLPVQLSRKN